MQTTTILLVLVGVACSLASYIPDTRYPEQLPKDWVRYYHATKPHKQHTESPYDKQDPWQQVYRVRRATPDNVRLDASVLDRTITLSGKGTVWSEGDRSLDVRGTAVQPLGGRPVMDARAVLNGPEGAPTGTLSVTREEGGDARLRAQGTGTVWRAGDSHLDVSGRVSKTESRPFQLGSQVALEHGRTALTLGADRGPAGTTGSADARVNLWRADAGRATLDAVGGWQRTFHGPRGTGPANGVLGVEFRYRPNQHYVDVAPCHPRPLGLAPC